MIEAESGTRFSHSGIVFFDQSGKVRIAQALGDVHSVKLEEFLSYSDSTRPPFVIRNRELEQRFLKKDSAIEEFNSSLR